MSSVSAKISTSCTVYVEADSTNDGLYSPKTIHENIRKTLGGSAVTTVTASSATATVTGYSNGSPLYLLATSGGAEVIVGSGSNYTIYVKHTGHQASGSYPNVVLGSATTDTMDVVLTAADGSTPLYTCTLTAGQAIVLPDCLVASSCKILVKRGGSADLGAEYMYVPTGLET